MRADDVVEGMQRSIFRPDVSILKRPESLEAALSDIEDLRDGAMQVERERVPLSSYPIQPLAASVPA